MMGKHKSVFIDLDNTLYSHIDHCVPISALEAIQKAQANNHRIYLSTGRNATMAKIADLSIFDGCVFSCGAYITISNQVIDETFLAPDCIERLLDEEQNNKIRLSLECCDAVYMSDEIFEVFTDEEHREATDCENIEQFFGYHHLSEYSGDKVCKVALYCLDYDYAVKLMDLIPNIKLTCGRRKKKTILHSN